LTSHAVARAGPESRFQDQERRRLPLGERADDLPRPLARFRHPVPAGVAFREEPSDCSFWRWKESLDDESTKFFLRIAE